MNRIKFVLYRIVLFFIGFIEKKIQLLQFSKFDNTIFPLDEEGSLWFSRPLFSGQRWAYYALFYKQKWYSRPHFFIEPLHLPTEILLAEKKKDNLQVDVVAESILPIAVKRRKLFKHKNIGTIDLSLNEENERIEKMVEERFYYFHFKEDSKIKLKSIGNEIIAGKPIPVTNKKEMDGPKLVLPIFIDGLASDFFSIEKIGKIMPETVDFFSEGTVFNNCYTTAEWTLPSVASIFTGLYTRKHGVFHPNRGDSLKSEQILLSEYYQNAGYLTSQICSNWRKNPSIGYARGFDRTLYKREMECSEVFSEFFDFIDAFPNRNIMMWLTFLDLHRPMPYRLPSINSQVKLERGLHTSHILQKKSVNNEYDLGLTKLYQGELRRIDRHLGLIYKYLENHFKDDYLIVLFSDHGQSYLSSDSGILSNNRIKVPLMFRGKKVKPQVSEELVQTIDILPSLLSLSNINFEQEKIDGQTPIALGGQHERAFTFSESLYPGKFYKCRFVDKTHDYLFKSKNVVSDNGMVDISSISCLNSNDDVKKYEEILREYFIKN